MTLLLFHSKNRLPPPTLHPLSPSIHLLVIVTLLNLVISSNKLHY